MWHGWLETHQTNYIVSLSYLAYCHSQVHFALHYIEIDWILRGPQINIILFSDSQILKACWYIPFFIYTENKVVLLTVWFPCHITLPWHFISPNFSLKYLNVYLLSDTLSHKTHIYTQVHATCNKNALSLWEGNRQEGQGSPNGGNRLQVPDIFNLS